MVKKPLSFVSLLFPSFIILEMMELLFMYFFAPSYFLQSENRLYVFLFFLWSGMIGSPIVAMLLFGFLGKRNNRKNPPGL